MDVINLKSTMRRFGTPKLMAFVGEQRLEMIYDILNTSVTESRLVELLFARYGSQLFAQKEIRIAVLRAIKPMYQGYVLDGIRDENRALNEQELTRLDSLSWGRTVASSKRTLEIFGLGDECLPPKEERAPDQEKVVPGTILFPYQRMVKDRFVRSLLSGDDRLLLHMPTGAGKTRTCMEGLVDYLRSFSNRSGYVVWLAHSEELCEQAVETFKKIWEVRGDSPIDVMRLWGSHPTPDFSTGSGFVVASLQRVHAMRTSERNDTFIQAATLKSKCNMVIVDEAHKAIAKTYKASIEFISNINATKIVGLTATPGRGVDEGETSELVEFFHGNKITITDESGKDVDDPIGFLQENQYLAKIIRRPVATNVTVDLNESERTYVANLLDLPKSVLNKLAKDAERNALIIAEIAALYQDERNTIAFALSVEHAHLISELLTLRGINSRCVDGGTTTFDRVKYIDEYKNGDVRVLVNYGVLTTGFDAPNTNAVLIARPTASIVLYSQMLGRGIRGKRMGGNLDCKLVDLKDNLIGFPSESMAFSYFDSAWN